MKKQRHKLFPLVIILLLVNTSWAQSETAIRQRAQLFFSLYGETRFGEMWEMLSTRLRSSHLKDKKAYEKDLTGAYIPKLKVEILTIKMQDKQARVTYKFTAWNPLDKEWLISEKEALWVYENGNWYFDDNGQEQLSK
jgi:hypothetical protein